MRKREPFEDDGRTIADMSGIAPQPTIVPRRKPRKEPETNSGEGLELTRKEKRWAALGAMKAAGIYAVDMADKCSDDTYRYIIRRENELMIQDAEKSARELVSKLMQKI